MAVDQPARITPAKLRSGAPDALAALCASRGAAVFAYCERALGRDDAADAAARAFARLRVAILPPGSLTSKGQAEELLRRVTRASVIAHLVDASGQPGERPCADRSPELLRYLENALTPADRRMVAAHVGRCRPCAEMLRRLEAAEDGFAVRNGTPLPPAVAAQIVTALALAAPVASHDGDAVAVRDEALRLLTRDDAAAAESARAPTLPAPPARAAQESTAEREPPPETSARLAEEPTARPPDPRPPRARRPPPPPPPAPVRPPAAPVAHRPGRLGLLRGRSGRERLGPSRTPMLLRSAARLAAVVVVAGTVGSLLGIVIAALTGDDDTPSSAPVVAPTSPTPAAAAEQLRVDIASTSVRPATVDAVESAIVRVDVRVENATGRAVRPEPPRLLVDDIRVAPEPGPNSTGALLAPLLDEGAAADGTLRFDLRSRTAEEVIAARVRLRIAGKVIVLEPVLAEPAAAG